MQSVQIHTWTCSSCRIRMDTLLPPRPNWMCLHCNGQFGWGALWKAALANMPCMAICKISPDKFTPPQTYRRGSATALRICLGYAVYGHSGRSNAVAANYNAIQRGSKPRGEQRQHLLKALAGPHGATIARARLIQAGQADRFKIWPGG